MKQCRLLKTSSKNSASFSAWRDQRKKDDTRHAPERLFPVHAVLYLAGCPKNQKPHDRMIDHALIVMYEGKRENRPVPGFALDRHTARGRAAKRAWKHFWQEGAKLENPAPLNDSYEAPAREIRRDLQTEFDL